MLPVGTRTGDHLHIHPLPNWYLHTPSHMKPASCLHQPKQVSPQSTSPTPASPLMQQSSANNRPLPVSEQPTSTDFIPEPPLIDEPAQGVLPTPRKAPSQRENASPFRTQKVFRPGPYPSTWLLQRRNDLDAAFERAWAAYTTVYNREFKTHTSTKEIRERMMAGHNIHGEDVLLPRPTVEHRLTRRKKRLGGHGMSG